MYVRMYVLMNICMHTCYAMYVVFFFYLCIFKKTGSITKYLTVLQLVLLFN